MASGRIGSASGLNVFIDWTSTENSITANLYLYNQYKISTSVSKSWSLSINGDTKQGTISLGDKSAGATTLIGSYTVSGLYASSNYSISGSLAINLTSYNGSAVNTLSARGTGNTETLKYTTVTNSLRSRTVNSISINWTTTDARDYTQYSLNGGSWTDAEDTVESNNKSGYYTVKGLSPNTTYRVKTRCKRTDSQLWSEASSISVTTYDIAKISSLANFEHGSNLTVAITNPGSISSLSLVMKIGDTQILSRTVSAGDNAISFSDTELDDLYKKYGSSNSLVATFILFGSQYTNQKEVIVTLTGNQKTTRVNQNGTWKRGKIWLNLEDSWLRTVIWKKAKGIWERGI